MTRTHWWTLTAVLSLALTCAAAQAQSCPGCPRSPCGGSPATCPAASCTEVDPYTPSSCSEAEDATKDEEVEASEVEAKCAAAESCDCKDGKCSCESCKCAKCAGAKAKNCDCAKCKCGCEKCDCSKTAAAKSGCKSGCCAKDGCCAKGCCCLKMAAKVTAQTKESDKANGETESVQIVLENLTINYFGAGVTIKKIKVSYKGQGLEAGDLAKDLSSIGRAPACCPMPCYAAPAMPAPAPVRVAH